MDLIILNDGMYSLVPVTKAMMQGIEILTKVDCFDPVSYTHLTLPTSDLV